MLEAAFLSCYSFAQILKSSKTVDTEIIWNYLQQALITFEEKLRIIFVLLEVLLVLH